MILADINTIMKARQQFMQQQTENELVKQVCHAFERLACWPQPLLDLQVASLPFCSLPLDLKFYKYAHWERRQAGSSTAYTRTLHITQELDLVGEDSVVFKLIGPALIKQDLVEAKANVSKRLEFIGGELARLLQQQRAPQEKLRRAQEQARSALDIHFFVGPAAQRPSYSPCAVKLWQIMGLVQIVQAVL